MEEIAESLKPAAAQSQVFIHIDCQPLCIKANVQQMKELLTNLVGNAVKYNHPGGQVWVTIREQDGQMVIRVRDNGVGIPEESWIVFLNVFTGWIRDAAGNREVRDWDFQS